VTPGQEIVLSDDAISFAQATIALLRDPAHRARLGQAARELVCQRYDWSVIVPRLLRVYQELGVG
jgi:glycosyltransferase involved in cell wall biosynthesis